MCIVSQLTLVDKKRNDQQPGVIGTTDHSRQILRILSLHLLFCVFYIGGGLSRQTPEPIYSLNLYYCSATEAQSKAVDRTVLAQRIL
ncbi:hypothetical protein EOM60_02195 [Candidatus Saccharibacteria bacterium]|nr:hypothetical protein [Candidatus Saccharibacteria bacterium]